MNTNLKQKKKNEQITFKSWQITQRDTRDAVSMLRLGRSPGGGNGNPLQCSCLGNPWAEDPGGLQSMGLQKVGHDRAHTHTNNTNIQQHIKVLKNSVTF